MIHHLIGSALEPISKPASILHIVNDMGKWKSGFVIAISKKYSQPEEYYKRWFSEQNNLGLLLPLGEIQRVKVDAALTYIVNMVAQHNTKIIASVPPIRYQALRRCLRLANFLACSDGHTIHMPRIGAVRSGGDWTKIEQIIKEEALVDNYIYTLPEEKDMWDCTYENE